MSEFDDFEAMFNENSLDFALGLTSPIDQYIDLLEEPPKKVEEKLNCKTYEGIWNEEEAILDSNPLNEETNITDMVTARKEQESKLKEFMTKIKPINTMNRKISLDIPTEAGSPKKKKIRKMLTYK